MREILPYVNGALCPQRLLADCNLQTARCNVAQKSKYGTDPQSSISVFQGDEFPHLSSSAIYCVTFSIQ